MYQISARGARAPVEAAWDALAWADPSPAGAVDCKEDDRGIWRLDAFSESLEDAEACVAIIAETSPELTARIEEVVERDWVTMSLEGLPPVAAGPFFVAGSHALAKKAPGKIAVLIEAGPAFGTGHHGTTLGCLKALDAIAKRRRPGRILDIGTGTGVLAIAAARLWRKPVAAGDIDPVSTEAAAANARLNGASPWVKPVTARGTMHPALRQGGPYDLIFANILAKPLRLLAPQIAAVATHDAELVLSGLLARDVAGVLTAYAAQGFSLVARSDLDGWATLVLRSGGAAARPLHDVE